MESELVYYPVLVKWLESQGWKAKTSVKIDGMECDIYATKKTQRGFRVMEIEVKVGDFNKVIEQALKRLRIANYVYIAFTWPNPYLSYVMYKIHENWDTILKNGLGLLFVDHETVHIAFKAKYHKINHNVL